MSEVERQKAGKIPPLPRRFSEKLLKVELFRNLTHDTDAANFSNILVDADFNVYAIDHSRAFRLRPVLVHEEKLQRFSRNILSRLRELDRAALEGALGEWLTGPQIEALLKRRDLIVERADRMVHEHGEGSILY